MLTTKFKVIYIKKCQKIIIHVWKILISYFMPLDGTEKKKKTQKWCSTFTTMNDALSQPNFHSSTQHT